MADEKIRLSIPDLSLVVLIGVSSSGKSTFAREHFLSTEVLSADFFRGMVADDENSLEATDDAFAALHFVAARRLARGLLTVVDATNVQPEARKPLVELAKRYHAQPVAIVFDLPQAICKERAAVRTDRDLPPHVIPRQHRQLRRSLKGLKREGFRRTFALRSPEAVARVEVVREKLWPDRREERGPFDIIGDVHGCRAELEALLDQLGYRISGGKSGAAAGAQGRLCRRFGGPRSRRSRRPRAGHAHGGVGRGPVCAGQSRCALGKGLARQKGPTYARLGGDARPA